MIMATGKIKGEAMEASVDLTESESDQREYLNIRAREAAENVLIIEQKLDGMKESLAAARKEAQELAREAEDN
jgi:Spy/CpxP family protein refolding chaperone